MNCDFEKSANAFLDKRIDSLVKPSNKLTAEADKLQAKLQKTYSKEQMAMHIELEDKQNLAISENQKLIYKTGFADAIVLVTDILQDSKADTTKFGNALIFN